MTEMLKRINIQSLLQAHESLGKDSFKEFLEYYGIEIKKSEIEDMKVIAKILSASGCNVGAFDNFYIGYKIPQIGKEFDLLRFGEDCIINIELKKTCPEDKIKKQLVRNRYYLSFIGRQVCAFTFVSESKNLYFLGDDENLKVVEADFLVDVLSKKEGNDAEVPDDLFDPSDFLVSPFNSSKKFLNNEYFLTHQQEEVKNQIMESMGAPKAPRFISVTGSAGTGKTLLIYDLAKELIGDGKAVLIIHCGQLNGGHEQLKKNGWGIAPIKYYGNYSFENYDLIIVDEAQRIRVEQLDDIVSKIKLINGCCIFSLDKVQTLATWEKGNDVSEKINSLVPITQYKLSEKIRTNKEIAAFIKMLFNAKRSLPISNNGNIEINYFNVMEDAKKYIDGLDKGKWEILKFTPSQYNVEYHEKYSGEFNKTSHQVIGQEFDGVAVTIDKFFSYDGNGDLIYKGSAYYHPEKMLFQNLTRSRKRLNLVIIGNEEILMRCVDILQ